MAREFRPRLADQGDLHHPAHPRAGRRRDRRSRRAACPPAARFPPVQCQYLRERKVTFRQCLGHQTPFPAVFPIYTYGRDPDLLRAFVLQHEWMPGPSVYSDINYILLGLALERLERRTIRDMDAGFGFRPGGPIRRQRRQPKVAAWRHRVLCGEVHDDNCSGPARLRSCRPLRHRCLVLDFASGLLDGSGVSAEAIGLMRTPLSARRTGRPGASL